MPEYTIRDPQSNRTVTIRGDSPPTESELEQIFAKVNAGSTPMPAAASAGMRASSTITDTLPTRTGGQRIGDAAVSGLQTLGNVVAGAGKGALHTVEGLGQIARRVPGVSSLDRVMTPIPVNTIPQGGAQKTGYNVEQMGEFFAPLGLAGKAAKIGEVAKAGVLTMAQSGSPSAALTSAGITAAMPIVARGVGAGVKALRGSAEKNVAQALGATTLAHKATAKELAPQMLARGVRGSRQAMLEQASQRVAEVGQAIGDEVATAAGRGVTVSGPAIASALEGSKAALMIDDAAGKAIPIEGTQAVVSRLSRLQEFVANLGDDIPIDKAAKVKTAHDRIVSKAGLYGAKVGASATDSADAWAFRESASAFRELLAKSSPALDELNAEYRFWKGLKGVLTATESRTQSQTGGLIAAGMGGAGAVAGAMTGDTGWDRAQNAALGGMAGRSFVKLIQSPAWRTTVTAPMKQNLANALASGSQRQVSGVVGRILESLPARVAIGLRATTTQ